MAKILEKIIGTLALSVCLACSPRYKTNNIHPVNYERAGMKAIRGEYDYIVIHSSGQVEEDHARQESAQLFSFMSSLHSKIHGNEPIILLDGYECMNNDGSLKSLDEVFKEDYRLKGRRDNFPDDSHLEAAYAHNTPANTRELRNRKQHDKKRILIVTSDYHKARVSQVTNYYFKGRDEQIEVYGVETDYGTSFQGLKNLSKKLLFEFASRWQTWAIFKDEKSSDPQVLTDHYDKELYNVVDGNLVKKPLSEQAYNFVRSVFRK